MSERAELKLSPSHGVILIAAFVLFLVAAWWASPSQVRAAVTNYWESYSTTSGSWHTSSLGTITAGEIQADAVWGGNGVIVQTQNCCSVAFSATGSITAYLSHPARASYHSACRWSNTLGGETYVACWKTGT